MQNYNRNVSQINRKSILFIEVLEVQIQAKLQIYFRQYKIKSISLNNNIEEGQDERPLLQGEQTTIASSRLENSWWSQQRSKNIASDFKTPLILQITE